MAWQRSTTANRGKVRGGWTRVRPGDPLPEPPRTWAGHGTAAPACAPPVAPISLAAAHRRLCAITGAMALRLARGTAAVPAEDAERWAAELRAVADAMAAPR
jgi:hypothetical protein